MVRPPWVPEGYGAPLLVVLTGPAAVGKTTVLRRMRELELPYHIGITATTRQPRLTEVDGREYHFVSTETFDAWIAQDELLEHAFVHGMAWYGIPRAMIRAALARGEDVIVPPEVQGAATVRAKVPGVLSIFMAPPAFADLEQRIRNPERPATEAEIQRRLATARDELARVREFDYLVINEAGRVDETVWTLHAIMQAEKRRIGRMPVVV